MEDKKVLIESLFEKIKEYLNTSIELLKLKAIDKASILFAELAHRLGLLLILSFFFLFLNIGIAFWLGKLLGEIYYGFLIIAGFYMLLALLLLIFSKPIKKSITKTIITEALK